MEVIRSIGPRPPTTEEMRDYYTHFYIPIYSTLKLGTMTISNNVADHITEVDILIAGGTSVNIHHALAPI